MSQLTLILLVSGVALFFINILVVLSKKKSAFSMATVSLLLISLVLISGSLVNTLIEINHSSGDLGKKEMEMAMKDSPIEKPEKATVEKPADKENEKVAVETETQTSIESETEQQKQLESETVPQKIAREFVAQEMAKQVGVKEWEITESRVSSDVEVYNIADYDKPEGDMRIVWVTGNVKATTEEDNITGNVGFELELYQMKGEDKWRVGNHWGVLIDLEVTEYQP